MVLDVAEAAVPRRIQRERQAVHHTDCRKREHHQVQERHQRDRLQPASELEALRMG